jgi:hypothetical protein
LRRPDLGQGRLADEVPGFRDVARLKRQTQIAQAAQRNRPSNRIRITLSRCRQTRIPNTRFRVPSSCAREAFLTVARALASGGFRKRGWSMPTLRQVSWRRWGAEAGPRQRERSPRMHSLRRRRAPNPITPASWSSSTASRHHSRGADLPRLTSALTSGACSVGHSRDHPARPPGAPRDSSSGVSAPHPPPLVHGHLRERLR